jgi:hypothetical protein
MIVKLVTYLIKFLSFLNELVSQFLGILVRSTVMFIAINTYELSQINLIFIFKQVGNLFKFI